MAITTQMRSDVAGLYAALFGRAAERDGLDYWVQQLDAGQSVAQIAQAMYDTAPARDYYPLSSTNQEIIAKFYLNVLGRTADTDGLNYWTAKLNAGATKGAVIAEMITAVNSYAGSDAAALSSKSLFQNKVSVGVNFGYTLGNNDVALSKTVLALVTATDTTAANAAAAGIGSTFTLTTGADVLSGTALNDTFTAASGTLGADVLVDSSKTDSDTLNATVTVNNTATTIANIENLNISGKFTTTGLSFANVNNAKVATFSTAIAGGTATITGAKEAAVAKIAAGSNITTLTIATDATTGSGSIAVDAGTATTVNITGDDSTGESVALTVGAATVAVNNVGGAIEAMTLSGSVATSVTLDAIGSSLTVAGDKSVTLTSGALTGETVTNSLTGAATLTVVNTAAGAVDLSKVSASVIKTGAALGAASLTVATGAKLEVTGDLGNAASTIASAAATATTNTVDVTFSTVASQTGVVFSNIKTANVTAAAPSVTGTDLTFAVLDNGTNNINLSGANDVQVTLGTAKTFDASAATGNLTYTQAADVATTVKGSTGTNTVTFKGTTVNSTFVGQNGNNTVNLVNTTGVASVTAGTGNDIVALTGVLAGAGTLNAELGDGANAVTANAATTGTINVVTGSGADVVSATGLTSGILAGALGAGNDSVTATAITTGVISLDLGDGNDTITTTAAGGAATIVVEGGAGVDTFKASAGADFSGATLSLTNFEKIALAAAGTMTFKASDISGKSYTIEGTNTGGDALAVTAAGATSGQTIDLSTLTLDNTVTKAISATTITGSGFNDVITGTNGVDTINGGAGVDTIVFAATGAANGADVLTVVAGAGGDVLNFSKFLSGGSVDQNGGATTAIVAYTSASTSDKAIANKVALYSDATDANVDTAAEIAALIDGTGDAFSITAGGKAILLTGDAGGATDPLNIWFINDGNSDGDVADSGEVVLVGTIATTDLDTLITTNFAFA
jgi:hypothetical protein